MLRFAKECAKNDPASGQLKEKDFFQEAGHHSLP